ncbi:MAG: C4-type zinc ribbon domain-containing protein [Nitrospiraceae bacterium]|nr:C4-type zinc ribbon domain-containing protein [Nitrospiraceae bacterium]
MNAQLKLLIELQEMDTLIIEKNSLVKQIPRQILTREKPLKEAQAALEAKRREHDALLKQKKTKDLELEEMDQKIKKLKGRTSEIKTNKEYQAHLKEIEAAEKERFSYEDGILAIMEQIEASEKALRTEGASVKEEDAKLDAMRRELDIRKAGAEKELEGLKAKRTEFVKSIEPDVYALYMHQLKKHNGLAVAEARGEVCKGCNMNIMPQLFVEIRKNEQINQCPQCDRILFYKEEAVEEPVE